MKKYFILSFLFVSSVTFAQSLNNYKYVVVPEKFDFLREKDQFQLNGLTKFLVAKHNFEAYYDNDSFWNEPPMDNCKKLFLSVNKNSSVFVTKLIVTLKDCKGTVLFTSKEGTSREKEYEKAYPQALRMAFESFTALNHNYAEPKATEIVAEKIEPKTVADTKPVLQENTLKSSNSLQVENIANGYLLIDSQTAVIVLKLLKTSNNSVFIAQSKTKNGIVTKKGDEVIFEHYENDKLVSEKLDVSF